VAAGDIVPVPGDSFEQTQASASPDVLREMVREFAQRIWGRAEELRGQHRRQLARPSPADPRLLPRPLTRSDAGHRCALDQPWLLPSYEQNLWNARLLVQVTCQDPSQKPSQTDTL
jgi:hypothetical protein